MRLDVLGSYVAEMAAAKPCPKCGLNMAKNHYWYKGGWKCKSANLQAQTASQNNANVLPIQPLSTGSTVDQGDNDTSLVQPAITKTPVSKRLSSPAQVSRSSQLEYHPSMYKEKLIEWFTKLQHIDDVIINDDLTVEGKTDIYLAQQHVKTCPVKFTTINGTFLFGASDALESMENFPEQVHGDLIVAFCELKSLNGFPRVVDGAVELTGNKSLSTIEGIAPTIGSTLTVSECAFTSLVGWHKHLKQMNGMLTVEGNPITGGLLSVLLIRGCTGLKATLPPKEQADASVISNYDEATSNLRKAVGIINKHLEGERDIHQCQDELIDAGLDMYARM